MQRSFRTESKFLLFSALFIFFTLWLGYRVQRADFQLLALVYGGFFCLFFLVICICRNYDLHHKVTWLNKLLLLSLFLRFLLLFYLPNLSDDFYRFLWDGRLTMQGIHPFLQQPAYYLAHPLTAAGVTPDFIQKLNSIHYYTVYPPLCQGMFALVAWIFPTDLFAGVFLMKYSLLLCEFGTIYFLYKICINHLKITPWPALIYALNPLAIVEIVGNIHFEGAMLFCLVAGLYFLLEKRFVIAALSIAFSIAFKLLPLLYLPILLSYLIIQNTDFEKKRRLLSMNTIQNADYKPIVLFLSVLSFSLFLLFLPFYDSTVIENMGKSLDLYFQKFEFNASVYYLIREVGFWYKGYNIGYLLAPCLGVMTFVSVLFLSILRPAQTPEKLFEKLFFASVVYLLMSSTVHPWYVLVPMLLGTLTRFRFALIWSCMAILSYSHYKNDAFLENYWWIGLEYLVVAFWFFWDLKASRFYQKTIKKIVLPHKAT
jgi:alpha-1,6-mannosyltransferase